MDYNNLKKQIDDINQEKKNISKKIRKIKENLRIKIHYHKKHFDEITLNKLNNCKNFEEKQEIFNCFMQKFNENKKKINKEKLKEIRKKKSKIYYYTKKNKKYADEINNLNTLDEKYNFILSKL